jgi:hypothetical protein
VRPQLWESLRDKMKGLSAAPARDFHVHAFGEEQRRTDGTVGIGGVHAGSLANQRATPPHPLSFSP